MLIKFTDVCINFYVKQFQNFNLSHRSYGNQTRVAHVHSTTSGYELPIFRTKLAEFEQHINHRGELTLASTFSRLSRPGCITERESLDPNQTGITRAYLLRFKLLSNDVNPLTPTLAIWA